MTFRAANLVHKHDTHRERRIIQVQLLCRSERASGTRQ